MGKCDFEGCSAGVSSAARLEIDTPESNQAERLPDRITRYGYAKTRAVAMWRWLTDNPGAGDRERSLRARVRDLLKSCGSYLIFRHYFTVGQVRLHAACLCKQHLVCPLCAIRRGSKVLEAYLARLEAVMASRADLSPFLITVTVLNGPDLDERMRHLRRSMATLKQRRRDWLKGGRSAPFTEFAHVEGAFGAYEVSNIGNGWHPHLHMLALCKSGPDQAALQAEWKGITGDSFIVDVRPVKGTTLVKACMEVLKYAVKFAELSLEQNWDAYKALRGQRLIFSLGCLFGVKVPEELTDEPLEDLPYFELFYRYFEGLGAYSLKLGDSNQAGKAPALWGETDESAPLRLRKPEQAPALRVEVDESGKRRVCWADD